MLNHIVKQTQSILKIPETGVLDDFTEAAIRNFQMKNSLMATGELDSDTVGLLGLDPIITYIENKNTEDDSEMTIPVEPTPDTDQVSVSPIKEYLLPTGQYLKGPTPKWSIFLHHTAGWNNPFQQVDIWAKDQSGPIGTHFVIGGPNSSTGESRYDGEIVQCIPDQDYAWHLTIGNTDVHRNSIGIELCNFGWLTKGGFNDLKTKKWISKNPSFFYTWAGGIVEQSQVIDLGFEFRNYRYFHKYSKKQIQSLKFLLIYLGERFDVDIYSGIANRIKSGMHPRDAFEYWPDARYGKIRGVFCHSNVLATGKWDMSPQPSVVELLQTL